MRKSLVLTLAMSFVMLISAIGVFAATKKATIRVEGMKCANCSGSVKKALKATAGVETVEVNHETQEAVIEYDDAKVTETKLREVINSTGFKAIEN